MATCHLSTYGWLLTDARLTGHGVRAARRLPPGTAIIVRSDILPPATRRRLIRRLHRIARARGLILILAGCTPDRARRLGADGVHLRDRCPRRAEQARRLALATSAPVHDGAEARAAARARIGHILISPLHATRSHVGAASLTVRRFFQLARIARARPVALGGMTQARHRKLLRRCVGGGIRPEWAAIDAWEPNAKAEWQR